MSFVICFLLADCCILLCGSLSGIGRCCNWNVKQAFIFLDVDDDESVYDDEEDVGDDQLFERSMLSSS